MKKMPDRKNSHAAPAKALPPVTACVAILLTLAGCASSSHGDFCSLYIPVYTSPLDTTETRQQADSNNAVWKTLCENSYAP